MTQNRYSRPRGAVASILSAEVLLEKARMMLAIDSTFDPQEIGHGPLPQVLLAVNHGELAVVNGEGVGAIATDKVLSTIAVTFSTGFSYFTVDLSLEAIAEAVTGQSIDLADAIRTFGDRLDVNHHRWFDRYDKTYAPAGQ